MFDFVMKMNFFERKINAALDGEIGNSLSTVFLDLVSNVCNHSCIFCDGKFYDIESCMFSQERLEQMADELIQLKVDSVIIIGEGGESLLNPAFPFLAKRLRSAGTHLGLYTNGGIMNDEIFEALVGFDFVRVSLDAGCSATHRLVHGCKDGDFLKALDFIRRASNSGCQEVGASFILLEENVGEIFTAAHAVKSAGGKYLELKPAYLSNYGFDQGAFVLMSGLLSGELDKCEALLGPDFRMVINGQLQRRIEGVVDLTPLTQVKKTRPCVTCRLRMVVSPTGCYLCTPHRSKEEYRIGDPIAEPLTRIWNGRRHQELVGKACSYKCAYHDQNELLLKLKARNKHFESSEETVASFVGQKYFL